MDIHEYQANEILARFGVAIPQGGLAYGPEHTAFRARELGSSKQGRQGANLFPQPRR